MPGSPRSGAVCRADGRAYQHEGRHVIAKSLHRRAEIVVAVASLTARRTLAARRAGSRTRLARAAPAAPAVRPARGASAAARAGSGSRLGGARARQRLGSGGTLLDALRRPAAATRFALGLRLARLGFRAAPGTPRPRRAAVALGPINRVQPVHGHARDRRADQLLDRLDSQPVIGAGQRERMARQPGAAGAADAVHVILGMVRHVEVEHVATAR